MKFVPCQLPSENVMIFLQLPRDFSFGLYDLDWDVFKPHYESAINRVPAIENAGIRSTVCGPGLCCLVLCFCNQC